MHVRSERITFIGGQGEELAARLDRPIRAPSAWALFAHCFSCSKDIFAASRISQRLAERGFGVVRFDFTGLGASDGDFANTNFSSNVDDLVAAAAHMASQGRAPSLLVGHSLGGAACLAAAARLPDAAAVVTLGAPSDAEHVKHNFIDAVPEIEARGEAQVSLAGRPFTIKQQFLEDISRQNIEAAAAGLRRALLVCHAPLDETVSIDNATRIFVAAKHPKSFVSLDDADHLLTKREHAAYAADIIAAWASRYTAADAQSEPLALPDGKSAVAVRETRDGAYHNEVRAGRHSLVADEPTSVGGDDDGPNPYEFLNIALAACTSMTLRMYADRKGMALSRVGVSVTHEKTHADDCADCTEEQARNVDVFERAIEIEGDLTADERQRLMEIADRCPVHRTLHAPVVVRTRKQTQ